jgi:DNA-binding MarR family transcriptional regulator
MKILVDQCRKYITDTLGLRAELSKCKKTASLPFFLQEHYDFYKLVMFGKEFVVLAAKNEDDLTPGKIRNHLRLVSDKMQKQGVFLGKSLSSFNRKRLIAYKVPFIVPGNQMYLPDLAIDLKEHFIKARARTASFRPATQAVVVYVLAKQPIHPVVTPKALAEQLGYSVMSMSRAVDEIEAAGIAEVTSDNRRRLVRFDGDRRRLWEKALVYLRTPVKKRLWANESIDHELLLAGESALAEYSMLAPPGQQVYAISEKKWKTMEKEKVFQEAKYPEEAGMQLEVWRYDPRLFVEGNAVDPFSLYLSLKESKDERIESAIEEMMENI